MNALSSIGPVLLVALSLTVSRPAHAQDSEPTGNGLPNPSFEPAEGDGVGGWKSETLSPGQDVRWLVEAFGRTPPLIPVCRPHRNPDPKSDFPPVRNLTRKSYCPRLADATLSTSTLMTARWITPAGRFVNPHGHKPFGGPQVNGRMIPPDGRGLIPTRAPARCG